MFCVWNTTGMSRSPSIVVFHLASASTTNVHPPPEDINHGPQSAIGPLAASIKSERSGTGIRVLYIINAPN